MKIIAKVSRGPQKGTTLSPHRHPDGMYVVSPSKREADYIRVADLAEVAACVRKGLGVRMSAPSVDGPRWITAQSIRFED